MHRIFPSIQDYFVSGDPAKPSKPNLGNNLDLIGFDSSWPK